METIKEEKKAEGYVRDAYPEKEEEIKKEIHEFVNYICNNNTDCTTCGPIENNREREIDRLNGFVIPLLIGLFQLFVIVLGIALIVLGIAYLVSFIVRLFS